MAVHRRPWTLVRSLGLGALTVALAAASGCDKPKVITPVNPPPDTTRAPDAAAIRDASTGSAAEAFTLGDAPISEVGDAGVTRACSGPGTSQPASCTTLGVTIVAPYAGAYTCFDLGPVPGVPPQKYGGLTLTGETCSTRLLIGGSANFPDGKIYAVNVVRDGQGHISGFQGTAAVFADAPYNDGGLSLGPQGVLFATRWPRNELQQTVPGSAAADKVIALAPLGVSQASASLNFVPRGLPGGGALKLVSWSGGEWYTIGLRPDAAGTFDITAATPGVVLPGGPEGFVYVAAGSPQFASHGLLVSEWTANRIAVYDIDENGDPKLPTRRDFITGLRGAEGAYRDPATGDFFFSTWGQAADRVIVVRGFAPIVID